jgi:small-conductance mechanosensitive channel
MRVRRCVASSTPYRRPTTTEVWPAEPTSSTRDYAAANPGYLVGMITLGVILMVLGLLVAAPVLWSIGMLLVLIGLILAVLGIAGRGYRGRPHYW